jgi:CheY-like chemotaxis protein
MVEGLASPRASGMLAPRDAKTPPASAPRRAEVVRTRRVSPGRPGCANAPTLRMSARAKMHGPRPRVFTGVRERPYSRGMATAAGETAPVIGRILLVEDDPTLARVFGRVLLAAGFAVDHAGDGVEGVARLATDDYDVLMSDVCMPRFTGLQLLEHARWSQPDLPVVLLTARLDAETYGRARDMGTMRYLLKPVSIDQLVRAAENALVLRATLRRTRARRSEPL